MSDGSQTPKKGYPDQEDLETLSRSELVSRLKEQDLYIKQLENKRVKLDRDDGTDSSDRLKQQQKDAARRENTLVHRLTTKEQELQDFVTQITELKQAQTQGTAQLRSMLLDPAVNIVFQRMAKELDEAQEKLKQTQNELSAWKFTPDSQTGKRLMARCQMLLQENEELGKTIASGRTAKLEGEIALQKTLVTEMKNNQSELDEFLGDLDEDVEGMQTMIYILQQQLRDSKDQITALEEENALIRSGDASAIIKKTFSPKQRDKPEKTIKSEDSKKPLNFSNNAYSSSSKTDYKPMETGFYENDKTDSDLEAEYNYEGLYENEDKYQEELEAQEAAEHNQYEYEENGYKPYEGEYEGQSDYKNNYTDHNPGDGHEAMDTEETNGEHHTDRTKVANNSSTNHHRQSQQSPHTNTTDSPSKSDHVKTQQELEKLTVKEPARQQSNSTAEKDSSKENSKTSDTSIDKTAVTNNESKDDSSSKYLSVSIRTTPDSKQGATDRKRQITPDRERVPSPKPLSNISQENNHTATERTTEREQKVNTDHTKLSPSNDRKSPIRRKDRSPIRARSSPTPAAQGEPKDSTDDKRTSNNSSDELSPKNKSPGSLKEREPVLLKFLNGVTSTVDDIEDL